jgi:predicted acylesterase/phospholipase RssA
MEERTEVTGSVPEAECDLVMRGGVTSGAVYPGALWEISKHYKLRNVGGASAGAIAAVGAAACEYGRQEDPTAFGRLLRVVREITEEGFVRDLFQPKENTKLGLEVGLRIATSPHSYPRRLADALWDVVRKRRLWLAVGAASVVLWAAAVAGAVLALADSGPSWLRIAGVVVLAVLAFVGVAVLVIGLAVATFAIGLNRALQDGGFGLCRGLTEDEELGRKGLTDWLHETIQRCAGLDLDEPLTFRDLQGDDPEDPLVALRLVTTDLSASRPVVLPLPEPGGEETPYLFERGEFERLFPREVVEHLVEHSRKSGRTPDERTLYELPGLDLPVVVAARLSLSFPILVETVPLWRQDGPTPDRVQHTMSDGGISSNFPIHFFDSLLPDRPTFGLDLQPWRTPDLEPVWMSPDPSPPLFAGVSDLAEFGTQILNASRNWRDNMQSELPGFRDRICQIRLAPREGGLHLDMKRGVVRELVKRGRTAGLKVVDSRCFDWDAHRVTRYRTLMQMLQRGLGPAGAGRNCVYKGADCGRRVPFRDRLCAYADGTATRPDLDAAWCRAAIPVSDVLIGAAALLGKGGAIDFDQGAPSPTPTMRIVPAV